MGWGVHVARGLGESKIYSLQRRHTHVINFYFRFSQQGAPPVSPDRCKCSFSSSRTIIIGLHGVRLGSFWFALAWLALTGLGRQGHALNWKYAQLLPSCCVCCDLEECACASVCVWPCLAWPGIFNERIVWAAVIYSLNRAAALKWQRGVASKRNCETGLGNCRCCVWQLSWQVRHKTVKSEAVCVLKTQLPQLRQLKVFPLTTLHPTHSLSLSLFFFCSPAAHCVNPHLTLSLYYLSSKCYSLAIAKIIVQASRILADALRISTNFPTSLYTKGHFAPVNKTRYKIKL